MAVTFNPVITAAGLAAAISADGAGLDLHITHVAIGAAKYTPTGSETALVDRREKATILPGSSAGPAQLLVLANFTGYAGAPYEAGEAGFYAGDPDAGGILFAVCSQPAPAFFTLRTPNVATYTAQYTVALSGVPTGSVVVDIDPTGSVSAGLLANHLAQADPHPQYALPIGTELFMLRRTAPRGFLTECGAAVSRTTYAALWAMAQAEGLVAASNIDWANERWTMFGPGDGSTTFLLPDLRGEFVRGADLGRGVDRGRQIGSSQLDELRSHTHDMGTDSGGSGNFLTPVDSSGTDETQSGTPTRPTGGAETRPRNAARLPVIKAGPPSLPPGPEPAVLTSITASVSSGAAPLSVDFAVVAVGAVQFTWAFDGSGTSVLPNPTHVFNVPGTYDVFVQVDTAAGVTSRFYLPNPIVVS